VIVEGAARHIEEGLPGPQAAIKAMDELFGPVVGITLVLMAVFLPAAFLPGLTGQMYAQFALVIAATALLSAINAATLKPTQAATWLRRPVPLDRRNFFYRGFNAVYQRAENGYARLIGVMARRSMIVGIIGLIIIGLAGYGISRVATGFIPVEDQGYMLAAVQLPDGASLGRTQATLDQVSKIARQTPGVDQVVTIAGVSPLDNNATLANAGVAYIILKDWSERGKGEDLLSLFTGLNRSLANLPDGTVLVLPPPAIQGIGNAAGFSMQVELRDGSFDLNKLQGSTNAIVKAAETQSGIQRLMAPFRANVPQYRVEIDREKIQNLGLTTDAVFQTLAGYLGSSYVSQFNKFGRVFQIYVQGDSQFRLNTDDIGRLTVRNQNGDMIPLGTLLSVTQSVGPSLISLYNLYPTASISGVPAAGFSSGDAMKLMEQIAANTLPPGTGYNWTALSYQEKIVGGQIYLVFGMALLLVYLVLAGQYESWLAPISVLLAAPMSLVGPVLVLTALRIDNNLYVQIGLILLIALSAKNAILIVEVARELRAKGTPIIESAVDAARARFRPILMTSFAFILGVAPLVVATGAGASARKSIGITVFSGMIASTCLAVLFVPSFFVIVQRFEEWRATRKAKAAAKSVQRAA
jgi:HAE1 family hydrophobic/amphiphilic exporter-1